MRVRGLKVMPLCCVADLECKDGDCYWLDADGMLWQVVVVRGRAWTGCAGLAAEFPEELQP